MEVPLVVFYDDVLVHDGVLVVPLVAFRILVVPLVVFQDDVLVYGGVLVVPLVAFRILVVPLVVFQDDVLVHDGVLVVRSEYNDVLLILFHDVEEGKEVLDQIQVQSMVLVVVLVVLLTFSSYA
jgi:hypothetical protein